ncbi:hypothetical protein ANCDUO_07203 [Ancylostoma duodenale]|uniref:Uncharacterized protein n=1 Tax=Ancylostoma duodenale TaxID=51022 RepID=A0A0C2GU52_9BILA|nr:hypothetical protein ANCDUO_07203 [Ancylostoma duodenale]
MQKNLGWELTPAVDQIGPRKRHHRRAVFRSIFRGDSNESNTSDSDAVLEFTRKLQNYPPNRRETQRQMFRSCDQPDSQQGRQSGHGFLPELEINGASPPRSPGCPSRISFEDSHLLFDSRRPSSPQAIPGVPQIEIRRPSALSQFEFGYFVNSPELIGNEGDLLRILALQAPCMEILTARPSVFSDNRAV